MGQQCSREFCHQEVEHEPFQLPPLILPSKTTKLFLSMRSIHEEEVIEEKQEEYLLLQSQRLIKKQTLLIRKKTLVVERQPTVEQQEQIEEKEQKEDFTDYERFVYTFRKLLFHYKQHEIDAAFELSKSLKAMEDQIKKEREITQDQFDMQVKNIQLMKQKQYETSLGQYFDPQILGIVQAEHQDMLYYFNQSIKAPFTQKYNKNGIVISTRKDQKNFAFLVETELHSPFQNLTTFLTDITYFPDVLPFCDKAELIKDGGRNSKVGYAVIDFPMLSKRQAFFETLAYNRMNHNKEIFLYARSIHDKPQLQQALGVEIRPNKKYVQLGYKFFVIRYQPLGEKVGNLKISANFDLGMDYLPEFIEEYAVRQFGKRLIKRILQINENFEGSKWQKGIETNPGMYLIVRQKIQEYVNNLKRKQDHHQQ